jgi:serine/threonine protein kinase
MKKGGRIFNHGYKGIVMSVYNISGRDKKTLYKEIEEKGKEDIQLIGINEKKRIRVVGDEINNILELIKDSGNTDDILVKKFVYASMFDSNENNFKNEMRGYLQLFRIFGRDVEKYTTMKAGFVYKGMKVYGIICKDNYYVFLEKCNKTIEEIKFDNRMFYKMVKEIKEVLKILDDNKYIHNDIKPDNIIYCERVKRFKLVDWDLSTSYRNKVNVKKITIFKNGSFIYNHPIKFENTGISYLMYDIGYKMETMNSDRYKYMRKLISPIMIKDKIRDNMSFVRKINEEKGRGYYVKYYDKYSFALSILFMGECNNIHVDNKWVNNILSKFGIILKFK